MNQTIPENVFAGEAEIAFPGGVRTERVVGGQEVLADGTLGPFVENPRDDG